MCRSRLDTVCMQYRWIYNSYSSSSNQEKRSIWFNLAITNTTNYSFFIYNNPATTTTTTIIHSSSSSLSLSPPPLFTTIMCTEADVVEDTTTITLHLLHSVLYCVCTRAGGGLSSWWGGNGMEYAWWNDNIIITIIEQYQRRHSSSQKRRWRCTGIIIIHMVSIGQCIIHCTWHTLIVTSSQIDVTLSSVHSVIPTKTAPLYRTATIFHRSNPTTSTLNLLHSTPYCTCYEGGLLCGWLIVGWRWELEWSSTRGETTTSLSSNNIYRTIIDVSHNQFDSIQL